MNIHLRTAFSNIKRVPFQAMAAIFILSLTFFVATLVSILTFSSSKIIDYFETRPQVIAFLKDGAKAEEISALQNSLISDSRVKEVTFVSKEEALGIYKKATSDNPLLGEIVSPTIFPASLEFSVNDLSFAQEIIDKVKEDKIVDSIGFTASLGSDNDLDAVVGRLKTISNYIKIGGGVITVFLGLASFVMLIITISMRMITKKEEMEILDLIGATKSFIKKPIVWEAIIYSLIGVLVGWTLAFISILYSAPSLISYFGDIPILPKDTLGLIQVFGIILASELFLGILLSFFGSSLAISRAKKTR